MSGRNELRETARPEAMRRVVIRCCVGWALVVVLLATVGCFAAAGIASYVLTGGDYLPPGYGWVLGGGFLGIIPSIILWMVWGSLRETEIGRITRDYHL